ncbi:hypothetical protein Hamer_G009604, partial [Homarus americanus]
MSSADNSGSKKPQSARKIRELCSKLKVKDWRGGARIRIFKLQRKTGDTEQSAAEDAGDEEEPQRTLTTKRMAEAFKNIQQ